MLKKGIHKHYLIFPYSRRKGDGKNFKQTKSKTKQTNKQKRYKSTGRNELNQNL